MKTRDPKKVFKDIKEVPDVKPNYDGYVTEIRKYKLITPLFGGGVKPQEADPITAIRGTSVRGQLRFWWRATRGGQFNGDLDKMRDAENAIWGSAAKKGDETGGPSKVQVVTVDDVKGQPLKTVPVKNRKTQQIEQIHVGEPKSPLSYVAFPLRKEDNKPARELREQVAFSLMIEYPSPKSKKGQFQINDKTIIVQDEVQATLWAWETFGGIGARTKRGFGAMQLLSVNGKSISSPKDIDQYLYDGLSKSVVAGKWPNAVPHLSLPIVTVPKSKNADTDITWKYLFQRMRDFRQARHPGSDKPGRSKWPEPDAIRRLTGSNSPGHEPKHPIDGKFPRAQFGLPIIVQFKKDDHGEPSQHTLRPQNSERWASPLILRPVACSDGFIGLAIRLSSSLSDIDGDIVLEDSQKHTHKIVWEVNKADAKHIEPLHNENDKTDVIEAFLEYLKK